MKTQDLYKFTMFNAVIHNFGYGHTCTFRFKCRGQEKLGVLAEAIKNRFTNNGITQRPFDLNAKAIDFLFKQGFNLAPLVTLSHSSFGCVNFVCENRDGELFLEVSGPWHLVTFFEIPVLSAVQEEWSRYNGWLDNKEIFKAGIQKLVEKVEGFNQLTIPNHFIVEMGTRRAFSNAWLQFAISYLAWNLNKFAGTSNVGMAMELGVPCKGTMAHEYLQMGQVLAPSLKETNKFMLNAWRNTYGDKFGIALSDVLTSDVFFREFDASLANGFQGTRQDSGNPYEYGEKANNHYKSIDVSTKTKDVMFSDSLDLNKSKALAGYFTDIFRNIGFGIGTFFSHDMGVDALKIVMKMIEFDGKPVIKISDDQGKTMSANSEYEMHVRKELGLC